MSKILKIFYDDLKDIFNNFALLIVIIALCILPSLYAWFNIFASWDPYGSTGSIPIAVINNDKGTILSDKNINVGDQVVKKLKDNNSLGWEFVNSTHAKKGLENGKYYASIEIPPNFSSDLASIVSSNTKKAKLIYSVNEKINAIAPKITDKGASSIQSQVNQTFMKTVGEIVFTLLNDTGIRLEEELPKLTRIKSSLIDVRDRFSTIDNTIDSASDSINKMTDVINDLNKNMPLIEETIANTSNLSSNVNTFLQSTQGNLSDISSIIQRDLQLLNNVSSSVANSTTSLIDAINSNYDNAPQLIDDLYLKLNNLQNTSSNLLSLLVKLDTISNNQNLKDTINKLTAINNKLEISLELLSKIKTQIENNEQPSLTNLKNILTFANDINLVTSNILQNYDSAIKNPVNQIFSQGINVSQNVGQLLKNAQNEIPKVKGLLSSVSGFSDNARDTIDLANEKIPQAKTILNNFIDAITKINNSKDTKELINFLKNDVITNVNFLESPVDIVQNTLYPMSNYGASMTPFYTTLSLWVGLLILTSVLTTEVYGANHDFRPYQVYLGRGLTFLSISLMQALIVSLGDIFILGVKMKNPFLFMLISLFISMVFNFIVYSLVSIFGNVGKAIGVILLVLQVAGSGGTFPIEVTPKFFQMLYPFLPFTYGISALREAVGGIYISNLARDLFVLLVFLVGAICVNIFLKAPINKLFYKFVSQLEDSRLIE